MRTMVLFLLTAATLPCFAADNPWNGTWKLNRDRSQQTGTTTTFTKTGNMYHVATGPIAFDFACDCKDYPVVADRSMTCVQSGNVYTTAHKLAGRTIGTTTHTLAADGNTITEKSEGTRPDGTSYTALSTSQRVGTGKGLVGTWKEVAVKADAPSSMMLKLEGDMLHVEDPNYKEVSDSKLDGTPAPLTGPTAAPGTMISTTAESPTKVLMVVTLNGKEMGRDEMTVSADGMTLTDVSWSPGKESEKRTYLYEKQ